LAFLGLAVKVELIQFARLPTFILRFKKLHPNSLPKRTMFDEITIEQNGMPKKNHV
jgi:hypothetical protein